MFCNKCGNQIPDGSRFCSFCGSKIEEVAPVVSEPEPVYEAPAAPAEPEFEQPKRVFEEINWNTGDYPDANAVSKTDDIDFDWGANPDEIRDRYTRGLSMDEKIQVKIQAEEPVETKTPDFELPKASEPAQPAFDLSSFETPVEPEEMSASDKIDKFYTFSKKNEEFQQLLNREYDKIKGGNPIRVEQAEADAVAAQKFEERPQDPSMEAFLEREGVNKPYEPKAFESDVLARIEAQEAAREEERREAEARERALEEARLKAEEEKKAHEAAIAKAEAEARAAAEEEARQREIAEARERAAEEARAKAEEEARLAAEQKRIAEEEAAEQARLQKIEEERLAAEEEIKAREAEERARLQAESELRAAQEAAKIRAQQEARMAAIEEEKFRAEQERRKAEEEQLRNRLFNEQANLKMQADSAAAAEEVRKVLAQTARMKEEEAAKIRAAVAGLRGESAPAEEPAPAEPVVEPVPAEPVVETVVPEAETVVPAAEPAAEPVPAVPVEPAPEPVELTDAAATANQKAHQETQDNLSAMAKARAEFLKEFGIDPIHEEKPAAAPVEEAAEPIPATVEELLGEKPVTGRDTMLTPEAEMAATRNISKEDILSGMERTIRISKEELREAMPKVPAEALEGVPEPEEVDEQITDVEDLLSQFASVAADEPSEAETEIAEAATEEAVEEGFAAKEEPSLVPDEAAAEAVKPGLDNTMVMPDAAFAEEIAAQSEAAKAMDDFFANEPEAPVFEAPAPDMNRTGEDPAGFEAPAQVSEPEGAPAAEEPAPENEEESKPGAGRVVLKVLLVILIVIFAVELAGIGIKFLAPNSAAAEMIDNQLNKVIHLITGQNVDYSIPGIEYRV